MKPQTSDNLKNPGPLSSKILSFGLVIAMIITISTITSCRKKVEKIEEEQEDTEQTMANDNNYAENAVADIENMGSQVSEENEQAKGGAGIVLQMCPGATVTVANKIITVDFGSGLVCLDGRTRSGKLIYDFSASASGAIFYRNPGFSMKVSSQNYMVEGYSINIINKTITNTTPASLPSGTNPGINLTWAISANVSVTKPGGGTITWSCSRTKELINTSDPNCYRGQSLHIIWSLAKVKLNGSTSGTNANNEQFSATATNLVRDFNCSPFPARPMRHPFISGTIVYTPGSRPARTIDFGTGTCDGVAVLTINNHTFSINL